MFTLLTSDLDAGPSTQEELGKLAQGWAASLPGHFPSPH